MKILMTLFILAMSGCHAVYTAPVLWDHGSSAAFDLAAALWIVFAMMLVAVWAKL